MKSIPSLRRSTLACTLLALLALCGCSEQSMTRSFGGNMAVPIPPGTQLVTMTWKEANLWVLYYDPKTKACTFAENSVHGVFQGTVTVPNCDPIGARTALPQ